MLFDKQAIVLGREHRLALLPRQMNVSMGAFIL